MILNNLIINLQIIYTIALFDKDPIIFVCNEYILNLITLRILDPRFIIFYRFY